MAKYSYLTDKSNNNRKIQVESAKRDGDGKNIKNNYAKRNGYYATLGAGEADNIKTSRVIDDAELSCPPITFGIAGGEAEIRTGLSKFTHRYGKSFKWHQLCYNGDFALSTNAGWSSTSNECTFVIANNKATVTKTSALSGRCEFYQYLHYHNSGFKCVSGHKYLAVADVTSSANIENGANLFILNSPSQSRISLQANVKTKMYYIVTANASTSDLIGFHIDANKCDEGTTFVIENFMLFDLTTMEREDLDTFAKFKAEFPLDYYAFDAGSIKSAKSASMISRKKNQFDGVLVVGGFYAEGTVDNSYKKGLRSDHYIRVVGGQSYAIVVDGFTNFARYCVAEFDADKKFIQRTFQNKTASNGNVFELQDNTSYIKFATYDASADMDAVPSGVQIMVRLHWGDEDSEEYDEFEEYSAQVVELPNIELRSVPDYTNGGEIRDVAYASGGGKRRIGSYTFTGNESWTEQSGNRYYCGVLIGLIKAPTTSGTKANAIMADYITVTQSSLENKDKAFDIDTNGNFKVRDTANITSTSTATSYMAGKTILFELAEEAELSENEGWVENVVVDNLGTIEFTTDPVQVPQVEQPYFIEYTISLVEFLDSLYLRADGVGLKVALQQDIDDIIAGVKEVGLAKDTERITPYGDNSGAHDDSAFTMQTTGGSADTSDVAYLRSIKGKTVRRAQLLKNGNFADGTTGWSINNPSMATYTTTDNQLMFTVVTQNDNHWSLSAYFATNNNVNKLNLYAGHKYLIICDVYTEKAGQIGFYYGGEYDSYKDVVANKWQRVYSFRTQSTNVVTASVQITPFFVSGMAVGQKYGFKNFMIFDLGTDTEYDTILKFNRDYPKSYYPHNAGELISSKLKKIKNAGYNAFDGELEQGAINGGTGQNNSNSTVIRTKNYIKVIQGQQYTFEIPNDLFHGYCFVYAYDINKNFIPDTGLSFYNLSNNKITMPSGVSYVRFTLPTNSSVPSSNECCVHLTWDESRTGFEEHEEWEYDMPDVELRSVEWKTFQNVTGGNCDEIFPDGTKKTRIKQIDIDATIIATLENLTQYGDNFFGIKYTDNNDDVGINSNGCMFNKPNLHTVGNISNTGEGVGYYYIYGKYLYFNIGSNDTTTVTNFLTGLVMQYELATPTEEQDDAYKYTERQNIDDFGTQEQISDQEVQIPARLDFFYPVDYKAFIDSVGGREDIGYDAGEIVSHTELDEVDDKHDALYDIVKENLGGLLRHQLADKANIAFENTAFVDLGTLTPDWSSTSSSWRMQSIPNIKQDSFNILCPIYKTKTTTSKPSSGDMVVWKIATNNGYIYFYDSNLSSSMTATQVKAYFKGILLAYEKASS